MRSRIDFEASEISPESSPVKRTPEGYLIVDAYTARDGTLEYSDGTDTWIEYRPRRELQKAAASFGGKPVTDEHPKQMVNADTWTEVSKGIHMDSPFIEVVDGVGYLRAQLLITDAEMIKKIDSGMRELSIGFTSVVVPCENGLSPDGVPCAAVQTDIQGNHVAVVKAGRAGPKVRILMDGKSEHVPSHKETFMKKRKNDAIAAVAEEIPVLGPDGQEVMLPPWAAAAISELQAMKAQAMGEEPMSEEPMAPEMPSEEPMAPEMPAAEPMPSEEPAAPEMPQAPQNDPAISEASIEELQAALEAKKAQQSQSGDEGDMPPQEEKKDSVKALARKRAKLERLAAQAGLAEEVLDSDDDVLARAFIKVKLPFARLDGLNQEQIDTVLGVAVSAPNRTQNNQEAPKAVTKTTVQAPRADSNNDPLIEAELRFLKSQGYKA